MATDQTLITAQQLLEMPGDVRCELINGEVVEMSPSGSHHGNVAFRIAVKLGIYLESEPAGEGFTAEAGFLIDRNPDSVRCPDVSFVLKARLQDRHPSGFFPGPPDLAVEVISPNDRQSEVDNKVDMWLTAGTTCVWTVDPQRKTAAVHHLRDNHVVSEDVDALSCEDLLPGLAISVSDLF